MKNRIDSHQDFNNPAVVWSSIIVAGLFIWGALSYANYVSSNTQSPTTKTSTPTTTTLKAALPLPTPQQPTSVMNPQPPAQETQSAVPAITTNNAACVTIARKAAANEEVDNMQYGVSETITPTQAYFKNGDCYYELTRKITGSPSYVVALMYAPNDGTIAYCDYTSSGVSCYSGGSSITETVFHLIEAQYLSN